MKRILLIALIFFFPVVASAESIRSFQSDITIDKDGSFGVVETIEYDFEEEERHGIFRFIPTRHAVGSDEWFKDRYVEIEILSVTVDGESIPYELSKDLGKLEVKIGDPDVEISGLHTYQISYEVSGALYYDEGEVDLYWNVTGHDWEVPIETAVARVHDLEGVTLTETSCYFGAQGENNECSVEGDAPVVMGDVRLSPGEGLTIAKALDGEVVATVILERWSLWPLWLVGAFLWLIGLGWFLFRYMLEHKTGAPIIAQYEPYRDLKPMYTGVLFDGRVDPRDITADIVSLAERGFFKIRHIGKKKFFFIESDDYEVVLNRPYQDLETEFDRTIFKLLFADSAAVGDQVILSELAKNMTKSSENQKLLAALGKAAEADLIKDGFFEHNWRKPIKIIIGFFFMVAVFMMITVLLGADLVVPIVVAAVASIVTVIALLLSYRRRTTKGYEALDHLKGFKEFLSVTDKERFKFHNAPEKNPEQFMAYLPYAIAFGVEKEWAEVFKDISIPQPDWYSGQGAPFNAVILSQSLGTFSSSVSSATASASSGGGSAGGGAGGGGGGSW